jgi:hypothetical protein
MSPARLQKPETFMSPPYLPETELPVVLVRLLIPVNRVLVPVGWARMSTRNQPTTTSPASAQKFVGFIFSSYVVVAAAVP